MSDLEYIQAGVRLVAVTYQSKGVDEFKSYFKGDIYLDTEVLCFLIVFFIKHDCFKYNPTINSIERTFYGPNERWIPMWMGFLRPGVWTSVSASKKEGLVGNLEGEGRLLGGTLSLSIVFLFCRILRSKICVTYIICLVFQ